MPFIVFESSFYLCLVRGHLLVIPARDKVHVLFLGWNIQQHDGNSSLVRLNIPRRLLVLDYSLICTGRQFCIHIAMPSCWGDSKIMPVAAILSAIFSLHHIRSWCMVMLDDSGWYPCFGVCPRLHANFGSRLRFLHVAACTTVMIFPLSRYPKVTVPKFGKIYIRIKSPKGKIKNRLFLTCKKPDSMFGEE